LGIEPGKPRPFLSPEDADKLFEVCKELKSIYGHRERASYAGQPMVNKKTGQPVYKRIVGICSFSILPCERGLKDGVVNPSSRPLEEAPLEITELAAKLTKLNDGKPINYLSIIAYENEQDHIDWHQHNEDRCRDATVYIVSLGETRSFGLRRVCEKHRLCDACNSECLDSAKKLCSACKLKKRQRRGCKPDCKLKHNHFKPCKVCQDTPEKWTTVQPKHGEVILLPDEYNLTHEHAILGKGDPGGDKGRKGLRISLNTKNIRPEDALYVERQNRGPSFIPSGTLRKAATSEPRTEVVHCKRDEYDVYVGRRNVKAGLPESKFANRADGDYELFFRAKLRNEPAFAGDVMNLHGKRLGCWCKGTSRDFSKCHGHIVAKWADLIHAKWLELSPDKAAMRAWLNQEAK
jgi:hypothetical protein